MVLAAHGITASGMAFGAIARHLPPDWSLIALDLRGRGESRDQPGPFGIDRHATDVCAAAERLKPSVLIGHSMGAYIALRAAVAEPELFPRVVLIDGGVPLPVPEGVDPDAVLQATLGPALARLSQTFPTEESYVDFFRAHPALASHWSDDIERYVRYDITGVPGAFRSKASPEAVAQDGRDLVVNAASFGDDLVRVEVPTLLLYATLGMLGEAPGMLPEPIVHEWVGRAANVTAELVPGANHYTILHDASAAAMVADRVTKP